MRKIIYACIALSFIACVSVPQQNNEKTREEKIEDILSNIVPPVIPQSQLLVTSFGAKGDSVTDCKPAFDLAMLEAEKSGGARIVVPAGVYIVNGPIHFVSNVCLDIEKDAKLIFSQNPEHYLPLVPTSWEGTFVNNYSPLIYAYKQRNIIITGEGTINGNGAGGFSEWRAVQKPGQMLTREMNHNNVPLSERNFGDGFFLRPQLMQFYECENILLENFSLINSPFWCIHFLKSSNITARGIRFDSQNANNDGFDPEYSKNILIENIHFNNSDDNVAIKAGRDNEGRTTAMPSENIIIRNCYFKGLHGVVIGSEMSAGVRNVFVENCTNTGYCKRGIYMKSNPDRGGYIQDIYIDNVEFSDVEDLFYITSFYHNEGSGHATKINDIYVNKLRGKSAANNGLVIQGFPTEKVKNIYFNDFKLDNAKNAISIKNAENIVMSDIEIGNTPGAPSFVHSK